MSDETSKSINSHLDENRLFSPPTEFVNATEIGPKEYAALQREGRENPEAYWAKAAEELSWKKKWDTVLDWQEPRSYWFKEGQLNATDSCLAQHLKTWRKNKAAIIWEGEPGDTRTLTYQQLHDDVCAFAGVLRSHGIAKGDRVAIYMPQVPEIAVAMLACAHLGATHSVVFGGFSAESLRDRINDSQCKAVLTADGGFRKGKVVQLKDIVDEACGKNENGESLCPSIQHIFVLRRTNNDVSMKNKRDVWWHEALEKSSSPAHQSVAVDAEHPLFILYTSGTTGKPKGVVHSTGGYLTGALRSFKLIFDHKDTDVYWCSADAGWITGHSYVVYGPLAAGSTVFMYEGAPTFPKADRFWQLIERHKISLFYTAPTAIRTFMKLGDAHLAQYDLSSLRLLGTVGEPINPEAWMWYKDVVGRGKCPIVDTWWQTETGSMMIAPQPASVSTLPGSATRPLPGLDIEVVRQDGSVCDDNEGGLLVIRQPWPSMMRTVWGDNERYQQTYWSQIKGCYFTGDGARRDENGNFWIMGRVDDVVNVSGHRLGTMEIESALVGDKRVAEAAVVARPDEVTGQAIVAFVTLKSSVAPSSDVKKHLTETVAKNIGAFARPAEIRFTDVLPKTRSGKIMRRLLRELATEGNVTGDTTSLEDLNVIAQLRDNDN